jgi:hypothetical protein
LRLIVNNTNQGADLKAAAQGFQTSGDATLVGLNATVTFSAVPEPATFILFGAALGILVVAKIRRRPAISRQ